MIGKWSAWEDVHGCQCRCSESVKQCSGLQKQRKRCLSVHGLGDNEVDRTYCAHTKYQREISCNKTCCESMLDKRFVLTFYNLDS